MVHTRSLLHHEGLLPENRHSADPNLQFLFTDGESFFHDERPTFIGEIGFAATVPFHELSCGYVGVNDGWTDLADNYRLAWQYDRRRTHYCADRRL